MVVVGEQPDQDTKVLGHESKFHGGQTGEVISDGSPEVFESGIPKRDENRVGKVEFETRHSGEFGEISNDSREVCDAFKGHPNIISKGTKHTRGMGAGKSANEDVNCNRTRSGERGQPCLTPLVATKPAVTVGMKRTR